MLFFLFELSNCPSLHPLEEEHRKPNISMKNVLHIPIDCFYVDVVNKAMKVLYLFELQKMLT